MQQRYSQPAVVQLHRLSRQAPRGVQRDRLAGVPNQRRERRQLHVVDSVRWPPLALAQLGEHQSLATTVPEPPQPDAVRTEQRVLCPHGGCEVQAVDEAAHPRGSLDSDGHSEASDHMAASCSVQGRPRSIPGLARHAAGDWGHVYDEDRQENGSP